MAEGPCSSNPGPDGAIVMEPRPYRPFRSSEEYLEAMKEDLAEWLQRLYHLKINSDNFIQVLEDGVVLCQHANQVRKSAATFLEKFQQQQQLSGSSSSNSSAVSAGLAILQYGDIAYRSSIKSGSFFARDNVHNFIRWCRQLGVFECLLFETDDLVLRKNEKSFILCLLEVARRGSKFGMPVPLLVHFEKEIDRELANETADSQHEDQQREYEDFPSFESSEGASITDPRSLDEMVRDLVEECGCPAQFPMVRISEGKYRIGDTKMLIFVRILRNHVMVRVGGGWDTLSHYLEKHDPCRCRAGHRAPVSSKLSVSQQQGDTQMEITYERASQSPPASRRLTPQFPKKLSAPGLVDSQSNGEHWRHRSQSPSVRFTTAPGSRSPSRSVRPEPVRMSGNYGNELDVPEIKLGASIETQSSSASSDSSSVVSNEGYRSTAAPGNNNASFSEDFKADYERPDSSCTTQSSSAESGVSIEVSSNAATKSATRSRLPLPQSLRLPRVSLTKPQLQAREIEEEASDAARRRAPRSKSTARTSFDHPPPPQQQRSHPLRQSLRVTRTRTQLNLSPRETPTHVPAAPNTWNGRRRERTFIGGESHDTTPSSGRQPRPFSQSALSNCRAASASPCVRRKSSDLDASPTKNSSGGAAALKAAASAASAACLLPPRPGKSSNSKISPILQDILSDVDIDNDELILRKMEQIVNQYKSRSYSLSESSSNQASSSKVPSPRNSGSKIPKPVFYKPKESSI